LELPPEIKKDVERFWREHRCRTAADRLQVEDAIKLQHFYGGQSVIYKLTPRGLLIVYVGDIASDEFGAVLDALPPEERWEVIIFTPPKWNDPEG
jgi:hypothetical protein